MCLYLSIIKASLEIVRTTVQYLIMARGTEVIVTLGLEVIKLEYSRTHVRKQPIIALYFESENELRFCNLKARS